MGEHAFQAEVGRVLSLVINSLYSNKEIFLRELVSNAADALDKLRFRAITEPSLLEGEAWLGVRIRPEKDQGVLVVEDTGIGMTEAELVENLGTVAKSGSSAFLEKLEESAKKDVSLIGQFGVGFYSAYLVADRVEVVSRAAGTDKAWRWSSTGKDSFSVEPAERASRGTEIRLHLKEDQKDLLEPWRLRELVRRYSDFVGHPVELVADDKTETVNQARALWQRPKAEITDEQYEELYKHLTHDFEPPLARTHFKVEGTQEFVGLFWIPKHPPFGVEDPRKQRGVRLFVKRVLILDDCDALVPQWLRFVRGLVDSDDLPLNVSRELLQDSATLRTIKKTVTKRLLDRLDELAEDKDAYATFWEAFGRILKEGLTLEPEWKERIGKLARWSSTHDDAFTSLAEYVSRMKEGQDAIYYLTGDSREALLGSPYLETLRARGFEVLLMTDPIDTWAAEGLGTFDGKKLVNAQSADVKMSDEEQKKAEEAQKELGPLLDAAKKVLEGRVRDVRFSQRLKESPACLVLATGAMPAHLEKLLRDAGRGLPRGARDLELNPEHAVVKSLAALAAKDASDARLGDWVTVLYEQALVTEGSPLDDPNGFARRVTSLLAQVAGAP